MKKYKFFKVNNITFGFKYDVCPVSGDNIFHIYSRHLLKPHQAIKAFFNASNIVYNEKYDRYEAYSDIDNITVTYFYLEENKIFIISAYYED